MTKFHLKSMGCKSNQFEGQIVAQNLVCKGFEETKKILNYYGENREKVKVSKKTECKCD